MANKFEELKELQQIYTELDISEKIQNNETDVLLTDETLGRLGDQLLKIRTSIVE